MVIADTGFFIALLNRTDRYHRRAKAALQGLDEGLITTWPVLTETCHILLKRGGVFPMTRFMEQVMRGSCEIFDIPKEMYPKILKLMAKYHDLPMDLADASLLLLAENLNAGKILSTDERDFKTYRWKDHAPFTNLLKLGS